jgi:phage N-6-adenine-methyltransferase
MQALAENRVDGLIERGNTFLPVTVDELNQFIIIGKERLNAQKAKIRAIDKTNMALQAKEAALADAQDMADILLDAEVKLGEILEAIPGKKASSGGGTRSLPDDISKKASHQAQTLSQNREVVEQAKAEAREAGEIPTASQVYKLIKTPHVAQNSGENEWYTPPEYIEAARIVLGGKIDLDPASSDLANREIVKAETFYTKENSGLDKHWSGNVWMNPPYASDLIRQFASKFAFHVIEGNINTGIVLVNNATETAWFRELIDCASAVVFTSGRVRFLDPQGNPGAPLQGQALIYFGDKPRAFIFEFKKFGWGAVLQGE